MSLEDSVYGDSPTMRQVGFQTSSRNFSVSRNTIRTTCGSQSQLQRILVAPVSATLIENFVLQGKATQMKPTPVMVYEPSSLDYT